MTDLAAWLSLGVTLAYLLVLAALGIWRSRGGPVTAGQRVDVPFAYRLVPLGFLLAAVNFRLFFFWLPVTERGQTLMVKYVLYKLSFGALILTSETSARLYSYLFSLGSQLMAVLILMLPVGHLVHEWCCRRQPKLRRLELDGYLYLYPALTLLLIFHVAPIFYSAALSLYRGPAQDMFREFVGLEHFRALLDDQTFWGSLRNTAWFALGSVPVTIACSLGVALLLNQKIRGLGFYRTVYFLPVITSVAAISLVWRWVYHPQRGVLNLGLQSVGLPGLNWLYDPRGICDMTTQATFGFGLSAVVRSAGEWVLAPVAWLLGLVGAQVPAAVSWVFLNLLPGVAEGPSLAITAIILMSAWKGLGYNVIIFLAGLQNIPTELYDASKIDGASVWQRFRNVTWPLLSPTTYFVLIMSTISSFQVFAQILMLYAGNATDGSRVVVFYLFEKGFQTFEFGYASALAYALFLIIFTFTWLQRRLVGDKVHYD